jgi:predicted DNA-binding transcriptional regulator YafY
MQIFLRRLEILNYLRQRQENRAGPVGINSIIQHLTNAGYISEEGRDEKSICRLIQRDLSFLLGEADDDGTHFNDFGLATERGDRKTLLWSLDPYQSLNYDFEKMPAFMALALSITQKHLKQVLPAATQKELAQLFKGADTKLEQQSSKLEKKHYKRLSDSVEFYQRGQSLQAPEFDMQALDRVYQAILQGKRITISYRSAKGQQDYDLHPYGVAIMLPKIYLVAQKDEDQRAGNQSLRSFLMHKIDDIRISNFSNQVPETFAMRRYLETGNMDLLLDFDDESYYQLELEVYASAGSNLVEDLLGSPISDEQSLKQVNENTWVLRAQVRRTIQLKNWLLALGGQAKVIAPEQVRDDLRQALMAMLNHY